MRVGYWMAGTVLVLVALLGFVTLADDARHGDELLGVVAILIAGLAFVAAGFRHLSTQRFPLHWLATGIAAGAIAGLALNQVALAVVAGAGGGLVIALVRRPSPARTPASVPAAPVLAALASEPGPSPWYLRAPGLNLASARGPLVWRDAGKVEPLAGKMVLSALDGTALLVVGMYVYVRALEGTRFVTWRQRKAPGGDPTHMTNTIDVDVFDADGLTPLVSVADACRELDASPSSVCARGDRLAHVDVPVHPDAGVHPIELPDVLRSLEEIFILADAAAPSAAGPPAMRICILRPRAQTVEVFPQDWFNQGGFDYGYEWITRVARDPASGRIVGDGIRIAPFKLDEAGRNREA